MFSPDAGPVLLQINKESKILTRQQLPPPTPSRDSASGPGSRCSCYAINIASKNLAKSIAHLGSLIFFGIP